MALYVDDATPYDGEREREKLAACRDDLEQYEKITNALDTLNALVSDLSELPENDDVCELFCELMSSVNFAIAKLRDREDRLTGVPED